MARRNWSEAAPVKVRARVEEWIAQGSLYTAVLTAFNEGFDFTPEQVRNLSRVHRRIEELRASGDQQAADWYRADNSAAYHAEQNALELSIGRRHWAETTSTPDPDEERRANAERRAREQRAAWVRDRAHVLKAEHDAALMAGFVAQAEREFDQHKEEEGDSQ